MEENSMPHIVVNPRLRPVGNQISDSFKLLYKHWVPILIAQVIFFFASIAITITGLFVAVGPAIIALVRGGSKPDMSQYFMSAYFWIVLPIIAIPIFIVTWWAMATMISALGYKGQGMTPIGETFKKGLKVLPSFAILSLLTIIAYMGSFTLLFFPGIILAMGLSVAWYICAIEGVSACKAISTSWYITKGYKWSIFGRLLLLMLMVWGIVFALAIFNLVPILGLWTIPVQFALNFILTPYALAYFYCIYEDLREIRKDVYPFQGGISVMMIIYWILGVLFWGGTIFSIIFLVQKHLGPVHI